MNKRPKNTGFEFSSFVSPLSLLIFLILWEFSVLFFKIDRWILPAPSAILLSLFSSLDLIFYHLQITLLETFIGLAIGSLLGVFFALVMDWSGLVKKIIYPFLLFSQTVPFITIAPLLVIWFGYGLAAKVIIISLVSFFPITINVQEGLLSANANYLRLVKSMGVNSLQLFSLVKFPASLPFFFSGLRIAVSYSLITAVVSEWVGADRGLGILLIRSAKSYLTDRVFAVVLVISFLSLAFVKGVDFAQKIFIKN